MRIFFLKSVQKCTISQYTWFNSVTYFCISVTDIKTHHVTFSCILFIHGLVDLLHESIKHMTSCKKRSEVKWNNMYFCTSESEPLPRARVNSKFSRYETKKKLNNVKIYKPYEAEGLRRKLHEQSARESKTLAV